MHSAKSSITYLYTFPKKLQSHQNNPKCTGNFKLSLLPEDGDQETLLGFSEDKCFSLSFLTKSNEPWD